MKEKALVIALAFFVTACSCVEKEKPLPVRTYLQGVVTDSSWLPIEFNGVPVGYGSGFLINRGKGIFLTNLHVASEFRKLGARSSKMFFNGKVYSVEVIAVPPLMDAAAVRITNSADFSEFPKPAPVSGEEVKPGDIVYIQGIHVHPLAVREADEAEGFRFQMIPIFCGYYKANVSNYDGWEAVYEKIPGIVLSVDNTVTFGDRDEVGRLKDRSNTYFKVQLIKDHKFSFGGLSGSPVKNIKGEIVGILTGEPDDVKIFNIVYAGPASMIGDLLEFVK